jgi:flagellar hook-basal body complex protein FliE
MTVDALTPGLRILPADVTLRPAGVGSTRSSEKTFGEQLESAVSGVAGAQQDAEYKVNSMLSGGGTEVHDAMIAVQKADLSFQLMLQVRNKVVQAYQEIERMQF